MALRTSPREGMFWWGVREVPGVRRRTLTSNTPPPSRIHGGISTVEVGIVRFHASVLQHLCSLQNAYIIHTNAGRHGPKVCAQPAVTCFYACLDTMVRHTVVGQQWNAMVSARLTLRKGSISKSKTKHLQKAANTHRV